MWVFRQHFRPCFLCDVVGRTESEFFPCNSVLQLCGLHSVPREVCLSKHSEFRTVASFVLRFRFVFVGSFRVYRLFTNDMSSHMHIRSKRSSPKIPLKYIDVVGQTKKNLEHMEESTMDDDWNVDGNNNMSEDLIVFPMI